MARAELTQGLRAGFSSTFNWVNPNALGTNITLTTFGEITTFRAPRRIQLALKFIF